MTNSVGQPTSGARFELRRTHNDDQTATYQIQVFHPEITYTHEAQISLEDGLQSIQETTVYPDTQDASPPEWITRHIHFLCKQLQRDATKEQVWPRKLRQWKEDK